jgi:MFS transporter, CP family, cyanate transporter
VTIPARPLWQGRALAVFGIALMAFSMRSAVASLSPMLRLIEHDVPIPVWVVGLIATAPPLCFALVGMLTPALERRFGLQQLAVVVLGVVTVGLIARAFASSAWMLLAATILIFAAVGAGNILLPPLVKVYFPDRIGLMTSVYATLMATGTFVPPLVAVPIAYATDWHVSLLVWAIFAFAALLPWIALLRRDRAAADEFDEPNRSVAGRLWRLPLAWAMVVTFAASAVYAYTAFAWLPSIMTDLAGVDAVQAGLLLALFGAVGLPSSLLIPVLVARYRHAVGVLFALAIVGGLVGVAGLAWAAQAAPWLWAIALALLNMLFPLVLVLLNLRTRTHEASVGLSGFVQSIGFAIGAAVTFLVSVLHDVAGGWTAVLITLAAVALVAAPAGVLIARPHTVEADWERRHGAW